MAEEKVAERVCVVGLGYVGLPLALAFAREVPVVGFDIDAGKIGRLRREHAGNPRLELTTDPADIGTADFVLICVPTPVTPSKEPDLRAVVSAAETIGANMKKGCTVVLESTVFPGCTDEIIRPLLEKRSGLTCGRDFKVGYSPERINPGDDVHTLKSTTKVIAGMDGETTARLARLYRLVAGEIFIARDIMTAEAAKVIENIQRDLNIALMNELALIFGRMGINTADVLDAAATKWNFHRYSPGLVGGHCIPVDPYYLVSRAIEYDYHSQVILSGRAINDSMPGHVAEMAIKALNNAGKVIKDSRVLIMGLTYKENVSDIRESPVRGMIKELKEFGVDIYGYDPLLAGIDGEFGIRNAGSLKGDTRYDAIIITVNHDQFRPVTLEELKKTMTDNPVLIDVRQLFKRASAEKLGFRYLTL